MHTVVVRQAAVALALVAGAGAAHAQTVITREITTEPVETIVQRGPGGTVITRRPLEMTVPRLPVTLPADTVATEPVETIEQTRVTTGVSTAAAPAELAPLPRHVVQRARVSSARQVTRTRAQPVRQATVRRPESRVTRTARVAPAVIRTRAVRRAPAVWPRFTAAQRTAIYRTIVRERAVPRTVVTEVPQTVVTEPRYAVPPFGLPFLPPPTVRQEVVTQRVITRPAAVAPVAVETVGAAPVGIEEVVTGPTSVDLVVGARVPATVPLYALPASLALRVPAVRPYRYAVVDDRVFLVDPLTDVVVTELGP